MRQMKSNLYYIFWGIATVSVVAGQLYVGTGYRQMAKEVQSLTEVVMIDQWAPFQPLKPIR